MNQYNKEKERDIRISKCEYEMLKKKAQALEIIKEHWTYNNIGLVQMKPISMEDANLLKEVLL